MDIAFVLAAVATILSVVSLAFIRMLWTRRTPAENESFVWSNQRITYKRAWQLLQEVSDDQDKLLEEIETRAAAARDEVKRLEQVGNLEALAPAKSRAARIAQEAESVGDRQFGLAAVIRFVLDAAHDEARGIKPRERSPLRVGNEIGISWAGVAEEVLTGEQEQPVPPGEPFAVAGGKVQATRLSHND